jgi:uncharacterized protein YndB with AHSA1/START domain
MILLTLARRIAARPSLGGCFRVRLRSVYGMEHEISGEYLKVVNPKLLSMSWH